MIAAKYSYMANGWDASLARKVRIVCPWKHIGRIYPKFIQHIRYNPSNRISIRFWEDVWWGDIPLCQKFGRMFSLSAKKGLPISSFYSIPSPASNVVWHLSLRRDIRDCEISEATALISFLNDFFIDPFATDSCVCSPSLSGLYSSSSYGNLMASQSTFLYPHIQFLSKII